MSAPHSIHLRDGKKFGDAKITDTMIKDGLWDAFNDYHMGMTTENVAEKFQITRGAGPICDQFTGKSFESPKRKQI